MVHSSTAPSPLNPNGRDVQFNDNQRLVLGTGSDALIYYDGTNLVITPDDVGSGFISLDGEARIATGHDFIVVSGVQYIGDTANSKMTVGLTINQGGNDDDILALKSSDVAHALTSITETDTFYFLKKQSASLGGINMQVLAEDGALSPTYRTVAYGGTATTNKTTASRSLYEIALFEHDGANSFADITANGNIFGVRARVGGSEVTRIMVDEDGDLYSVTAAQTFDAHDDLALVDTYDAIRSGYREWAENHEQELIQLGILGGPVSDGGMTNVTQLQRLHNGAIRQLGQELADTKKRLMIAEQRLAALPGA